MNRSYRLVLAIGILAVGVSIYGLNNHLVRIRSENLSAYMNTLEVLKVQSRIQTEIKSAAFGLVESEIYKQKAAKRCITVYRVAQWVNEEKKIETVLAPMELCKPDPNQKDT